MRDNEIESFALWLHWTAYSSGRTKLLGDLIRTASQEAREIYASPPGTDDDDREEMPALVERFAAKWEECERLVRQDSEILSDGIRDLDKWGYSVGTQAARINQLLSGKDFLAITEVFSELVGDFPNTTRARVNTHIQVLRQRHRAQLLEQRSGRRVLFRLVADD
jgi:hypothetical protein